MTTTARKPARSPGSPGWQARWDSRPWSVAEEERIRRDYPSCASVAALAADMERPAHQLRWKASQMDIRRHPALVLAAKQASAARGHAAARRKPRADEWTADEDRTLAALWAEGADWPEILARLPGRGPKAIQWRAYRKELPPRKGGSRGPARGGGNCLAGLSLDEVILASQRHERPADLEARRSRAWGLAECLKDGPASWRSLKAAGWTEGGLRHLLGESAWFTAQEWQGALLEVFLSEAGREEFAAGQKGMERTAYQKRGRA